MNFLQVLDHNLGRPLPEKHYAEDCRIYTPENESSRFYNIIVKIIENIKILKYNLFFLRMPLISI